MWKNFVEWGRPQIKIWCMRIVCWIPKAKSTLSKYVNIYGFSTATMFARTRLNVRLHKYFLSFLYSLCKLASGKEYEQQRSFLELVLQGLHLKEKEIPWRPTGFNSHSCCINCDILIYNTRLHISFQVTDIR